MLMMVCKRLCSIFEFSSTEVGTKCFDICDLVAIQTKRQTYKMESPIVFLIRRKRCCSPNECVLVLRG